MKFEWIGPGNLVIGNKIIPPGVPEAVIEMSEKDFKLRYNERQQKKFDWEGKAKPAPAPEPVVEELAHTALTDNKKSEDKTKSKK